jgi:hypothetical protein
VIRSSGVSSVSRRQGFECIVGTTVSRVRSHDQTIVPFYMCEISGERNVAGVRVNGAVIAFPCDVGARVEIVVISRTREPLAILE